MPLPLLIAARSVTALTLGATLGLAPAAPAAADVGAATVSGLVPSVDWRWPLAGTPVVARPFQAPPFPWSAGHRGVDLAAPPRSTVFAAGAGVVSFAGYIAGVGVVAVIHGDGLRTTYEPVAATVAPGERVGAGDPIGRLLPGHGDCGPDRWCLHWGLLRGSVYLDPLTLLHPGPVRLLPLAGAGAGPAAPPARADLRPAAATVLAAPGRASVVAAHRTRPSSLAVSTSAAAGAGAVTWWWLHRRRGTARLSRAGRRAWP